ncbi:S-adenosyl-L-methionine-dependent methyltransferase [Thamnocephalis sphaerospora]|uniref:S-adenosyl-L-methionine-dependent methyltransferase n=1 Tax=Thamnocephalis sphaerospora TaxID=78915 RepID=A0A4P9XPA5_9FUNG|nr:S-adenosyl-L-methionine-dependent methyltransferase [Thamnocephalis sphaerospora]|eukprot:RKP07702.1 S-adenosyl-L-methionine-dependent methyltransferase [Thamnocephalis sphaerospora]
MGSLQSKALQSRAHSRGDSSSDASSRGKRKASTAWYRIRHGNRAAKSPSDTCTPVMANRYGQHTELSPISKPKWLESHAQMTLDTEGRFRMMPSDADDAERTAANHYVYKYVMRGNHLAKLDNPKRILDVGVENGVWLQEIATKFPKAKAIGIDIQDQLDYNKMPSNVSFVLADLLASEGLPFKDGYFDYVHMRSMRCFLPDDKWPQAIEALFRVTKPGGQIELFESCFDFSVNAPEPTRFIEMCTDLMRFGGLEREAVQHLDLLLEMAGFTDVRREVIAIPVGDWGDVPGRLIEKSFTVCLDRLRTVVEQHPTIGLEEYDYLREYCFDRLDTLRAHSPLYIYTARRPVIKGRSTTVMSSGHSN